MRYLVTAVTPSSVTYEDHTQPKQKIGSRLEHPTVTLFCANQPGSPPIAVGDHIEIILRKVTL